MQNICEIIGLNISNKRKSLNISQEAFSEYLGLSRPSIANIEVGRQNISIQNLIKSAYLFNCELSELIPKANFVFKEIDYKVNECLNKSANEKVRRMEKKKLEIEQEIEITINKILNRKK